MTAFWTYFRVISTLLYSDGGHWTFGLKSNHINNNVADIIKGPKRYVMDGKRALSKTSKIQITTG